MYERTISTWEWNDRRYLTPSLLHFCDSFCGCFYSAAAACLQSILFFDDAVAVVVVDSIAVVGKHRSD